jgi:hypothetical protein
MRVTDIRVDQCGNARELSGMLGNFRLWWRFPSDCTVSPRGDAFLVMALLPAMVMGESVEVESSAPVSPKLLASLDVIQNIFCTWDDRFHKISVHAAAAPPDAPEDATGSFFSAGIDAGYTYFHNSSEITHLIFLRGHEIPFQDEAVFSEVERNCRAFALRDGKQLVWVETNRQKLNVQLELLFPSSGVRGDGGYWDLLASQGMAQGSILAATALALRLKRVYVPSSHTYQELIPYPSHPLLDPLWSTESTEFIHDGAELRRSEKLARIAADPGLMQMLRVCREGGAYNCGVCGKCVRTRIALRLLGLSAPTLPPLDSLRPVRMVSVENVSDLTFYEDNFLLAQEKGDRALARLLARKMLRFSRRELIKQFDKELLGGSVIRSVKRLGALRSRRKAGGLPSRAPSPPLQPAVIMDAVAASKELNDSKTS